MSDENTELTADQIIKLVSASRKQEARRDGGIICIVGLMLLFIMLMLTFVIATSQH